MRRSKRSVWGPNASRRFQCNFRRVCSSASSQNTSPRRLGRRSATFSATSLTRESPRDSGVAILSTKIGYTTQSFHFISSETFIETHKNVSILYADICGFTPLTEKFTKKIVNGKEVPIDRIEDLVATLNDLFAKFDEAADVRNKGDASFYFPLPRTVTYFTKISSSQSVILLWRLLK